MLQPMQVHVVVVTVFKHWRQESDNQHIRDVVIAGMLRGGNSQDTVYDSVNSSSS